MSFGQAVSICFGQLAVLSPFLVIVRRAVAALILLAAPVLAADTPHELPGPLSGVAYGSGSRALVVYLHGDLSGGGAADYLYNDARNAAAKNSGVVAAAVLRPGYHDANGRQSAGSANERRDHYTPENNRLVAETIANLQRRTGARHVIAIGHSGGAAQLGAILGSHPGLIDKAILAGCPCDIPNWRIHRAGRPSWPNSVSPMDRISGVRPGVEIVALVGRNDTNTLPQFSVAYVEALQARGVRARLATVPGGHRYRDLREPVRKVLTGFLQRMN